MIEATFHPKFKRQYKKKVKGKPELEDKFYDRLSIFMNNPFDNRLKTLKLAGQLSDLYSFSVEYDLRVVFYFVNSNNVIFLEFGTREEVY